MDQRAAFARAQGVFLNYHAAAKWASLAASVGTAVLYVFLLMLLGLFANLMVHRGEIPSYRRLAVADQKKFRDDWQDPLGHFQARSIKDTAAERAPEDKVKLMETALARLQKAWGPRLGTDTGVATLKAACKCVFSLWILA